MRREGRWRCDDCVEEYTVAIDVEAELGLPAVTDYVVEMLPCPTCQAPMRRLDPRVE